MFFKHAYKHVQVSSICRQGQRSTVYEPFDSQVGVKQGCVMSPLLFNLYLSDFPDIFDSTCEPDKINNTSVNCLMFADDIVIMSESAQGLQNCLDKVSTYCNLWGLTVNIKKTNVIIFNKGCHKISRFKFFLGENEVSIVNQYSDLGVIFSSCTWLLYQSYKCTNR